MILIALIGCGGLAACTSSLPAPPDDAPRTRTIFVTSNGWHTAIIVPKDPLAATNLLPEAADFPDATFLEFGWGDRTYYRAKKKTLRIALRAALVSTPSIMHMAGLDSAPRFSGSKTEVVSVNLSERGFRGLIGAIASSFKRTNGTRAEPVADGHYPNSKFYDATGEFHLFNTCNTWSARMLQAGSVDISPSGVISVDGLMARLRNSRGLP